ncbi:MAG: VIT1/CCC1 transporter family protein [Candidatus Saccharimonas sp.]|nr:VIT1/CCC1 transporter family protein [Candidatus Saccharimonas sp.]
MRLPKFHAKRRAVPLGADKFLAAFEGFEGGFAIGAGVIAGMSFTDVSRETLIMTAIISVIVNGFNSASVKYSSEHYMDELDGVESKRPLVDYLLPALVEFISYFTISFISIIPLFIIGNITYAVAYSCIATVAILLVAGYLRAMILGMPRLRDALEVALLGSGIILVGFISGWIIHVLIGA